MKPETWIDGSAHVFDQMRSCKWRVFGTAGGSPMLLRMDNVLALTEHFQRE